LSTLPPADADLRVRFALEEENRVTRGYSPDSPSIFIFKEYDIGDRIDLALSLYVETSANMVSREVGEWKGTIVISNKWFSELEVAPPFEDLSGSMGVLRAKDLSAVDAKDMIEELQDCNQLSMLSCNTLRRGVSVKQFATTVK
jgi:hypothetical protein